MIEKAHWVFNEIYLYEDRLIDIFCNFAFFPYFLSRFLTRTNAKRDRRWSSVNTRLKTVSHMFRVYALCMVVYMTLTVKDS